MPHAAHVCPGEETLVLFLEGTLEESMAQGVRSHVNDCDSCRALLADAVRHSEPPTVVRPRSPDRVIAGKYVIEAELGAGGMGRVYRARHVTLDRVVAIKLIHPTLVGDPSIVRRFEREARAAAALKNPHVVQILDIDRLPTGAPFIVMEFLHGCDLAELLRAKGIVPLRDATRYILEACAAIAEAHACGIVHRDVKPENLFLTQDGTSTGIVKVLDFGLAKALPGASIARAGDSTTTAGLLGSPHYMSPEHLRGPANVDRLSDIWAIGATLYMLVCGRPPFSGPNVALLRRRILNDEPAPPHTQRPEVPQALSHLILRALKKSPSDRWPTVNAFAAALGEVHASLPIPAPVHLPIDGATIPDNTPRGAGGDTYQDPGAGPTLESAGSKRPVR